MFAQTEMHSKWKFMDRFSHSVETGCWRVGGHLWGAGSRSLEAPYHPFFSSLVEDQKEAFKIILKYAIQECI